MKNLYTHHSITAFKLVLSWVIVILMALSVHAQVLNCVKDTTGGYTSLFDTLKRNPICNYELLTKEHLTGIEQSRDTISFFPGKVDKLYNGSGYSGGHVMPFQDLAYSPLTAKASMNLNRNLAPEPQNQNVGTELASEAMERNLAKQYGSVEVYAGTYGTLGNMKGINIPAIYWKVIDFNAMRMVFWMPTTGDLIGYGHLKDTAIDYQNLVSRLGFDPEMVLK